ncbi:MAG: aspartate aminotransferase family protein [bacterium]|nr:aspartate aminotransferase family protein [bacterium]
MNHKQTENDCVLPKKGIDKKKILQLLDDYGKNDPNYKKSETWSLVYYLNEDHTQFLVDVFAKYFSTNGLNPMVFQSLKKFETEVIRMTANLLHGDRNVVGVMTAGGTESCLLPVKTYRDYARDKKGIKKPEMILPETAHVAWEKGAKYFNVKAVHAPLDKDFRVDVKAVKKLINKNTVMILGSAPEYPHGIIDPIEELGELALEKNIPLHVDACVGGYLLPFVEKLGYDIPAWDYRVPGVTSISADTHKYGFSAKGASTITYRSLDILKYQFFVYENWPGGIFASPALLGTRPGGAYAAAWAAMQVIGEEGYLKIAKTIMDTTEKLIKGIESIPELAVIGKPNASLFAYNSTHKDVNIFAVGDQMEEKGWQLDRLQRPEALHAMVTPLHANVADKYISDLKSSVAHVKKHPELALQGGAAMYGMIANIPLRGMVKKNVLNMFADMYGPDAKMIDPAAAAELEDGEEGSPQEVDFATKAAMFFLKIKNKFK